MASPTCALSPSSLLLHNLRRPQPQPITTTPSSSLFSFFSNPLYSSSTTAAAGKITQFSTHVHSNSKSLLVQTLKPNTLLARLQNPQTLPFILSRFVRSSFSAAFSQTASLHSETTPSDPENDDLSDEDVIGEEEKGDGLEKIGSNGGERVSESGVKLPNLSVKEKKELASYAHSLGKKLKCQLVGKSGVTDNVAASFIENLEANELLKIKIHRTCPGELDDVVRQLEMLTGSIVVGQIGRTVIIYRPSLTKLKAEEKKMKARRVFVRKELMPKSAIMKKAVASRASGPGRLHRSGRI